MTQSIEPKRLTKQDVVIYIDYRGQCCYLGLLWSSNSSICNNNDPSANNKDTNSNSNENDGDSRNGNNANDCNNCDIGNYDNNDGICTAYLLNVLYTLTICCTPQDVGTKTRSLKEF